jgi:hypothetical protein
LNYTLTPQQNHYAPTPKGNNIFETTTRHGFGTDLPRSPGGQHFRTSQHGSERPLVSATLFPSVTGSSAATQVSNSNGIASQTQTSASIPAQSHQLPTHHSQPQGVFPAPSLLSPPIFSQLNPPGPGYYPVGFYYIRFQGFQSIPQYCPPGFY